MSKNYDNWERLVVAVLRRKDDREIALCHSRDPSTSSSLSSTPDHSFSSIYHEFDLSHNILPGRTEIHMNYSDLTLHHSHWKTMKRDKREVGWRLPSLSFFVDKRTGKNCFLLGATKLDLPTGYENEWTWEMKPHPKSRFSEVAVLPDSSVFDIEVSIKAKMLSPETLYAPYLVFGFEEKYIKQHPANLIITLSDNERAVNKYSIMVQFGADGNVREDGWMEVQLGEFFVGVGDNREIIVQLMDTSGFPLGGIIVEGIEFRPLRGKKESYQLGPDDYSLVDYSYLTLIDHNEWKTMLAPSKKEVLLKPASLSFFLDQKTGKNCFLFGATNLKLSSEYETERWKMKPHRKSRFSEVGELVESSKFRIKVSIKTKMLSPDTLYAAYLVFGFDYKYSRQQRAYSTIGLTNYGKHVVNNYSSVLQFEAGNVRADKYWMEIRLGYFHVGVRDNREVDMQLMNINGLEKGSIIVEGIEFRPLMK